MNHFLTLPLLQYDLELEEIFDSRKLAVNRLLEVLRNITWNGRGTWKVLVPPEGFAPEENQDESWDEDEDEDFISRAIEMLEEEDTQLAYDANGVRQAMLNDAPQADVYEMEFGEDSDISFEDDQTPDFFKYAEVTPLLRLAYLRGEARKKGVQAIFDDILPELRAHFTSMWEELGLPQEHPNKEILVHGLRDFRMHQMDDDLFDDAASTIKGHDFSSLPQKEISNLWHRSGGGGKQVATCLGDVDFSFRIMLQNPRTGKMISENKRFKWSDEAGCWRDRITGEFLRDHQLEWRPPNQSYRREFVDISFKGETHRVTGEDQFVELMLSWAEEVGTRIYRLHALAKVCEENQASLFATDLEHYRIQSFERVTLPNGNVINGDSGKYNKKSVQIEDNEWPMYALHAKFGD